MDDDRRENHLQFVVLRLRDAAGDLSASRKHGLSVHLDGPGDAGRERITPVILIAGEGLADGRGDLGAFRQGDRKSTRLNSSHVAISYAVFCLKKKTHRP